MPSEAVIRSICREFNISERWLRTGEGEMEIQRLARLTEEEWALLERLATEFVKKKPASEGR